MPVSGIREKSTKKLSFKKFSIRFVLCIAYIISLCWIVSLDLLWVYRTELVFGKLINVIFNFTNLLTIVCFLELATKWPELMQKWSEVEKFLPQLKYQLDKQKMAYEIKMVSLVILFMSMGENPSNSEWKELNAFRPFSRTSSFNYSWGTWCKQLPNDSWSDSSLFYRKLCSNLLSLSLQWCIRNVCKVSQYYRDLRVEL